MENSETQQSQLLRTDFTRVTGEVWTGDFRSFLPPRRGKTTCLTKERTPLLSMFPGSQKAFFSFFFTSPAESSRSIFDSCRPQRGCYHHSRRKCQTRVVNVFILTGTHFLWGAHLGPRQSWYHRVHEMGALSIAKWRQVLEQEDVLQFYFFWKLLHTITLAGIYCLAFL